MANLEQCLEYIGRDTDYTRRKAFIALAAVKACYGEDTSSLEGLSELSNKAIMLDIVLDSDTILHGFPGQMRASAAEALKDGITEYSGPEEVSEIYSNLYDEPIKEILGE